VAGSVSALIVIPPDGSRRVRRQIPHHNPGDEGMIAAGVGVQAARHGRIDLLVVGRRLEQCSMVSSGISGGCTPTSFDPNHF
jgi:hypothetical protein